MGCCEDYLTCNIAINAVTPLSRASTCGRYGHIDGVTWLDQVVVVVVATPHHLLSRPRIESCSIKPNYAPCCHLSSRKGSAI